MSDVFSGKKYVDGDKDWDAPEWRRLIDKELVDGDEFDFEKERQAKSRFGEDETGIKHPKTGAVIRTNDDGSIEIFVNEDTGIRLDPKENAIILYGDMIHSASKDFHVHTRPHGLAWNYKTFNPALHYEDEKHPLPKLTTAAGKEYGIFSGKPRRSLYDSKVTELLGKLGIEVEER